MSVFDKQVCSDPVQMLEVALSHMYAHRKDNKPIWTDYLVQQLRSGGVPDSQIPELFDIAWRLGYALPMTPGLQDLFDKSVAATYAKGFPAGPLLNLRDRGPYIPPDAPPGAAAAIRRQYTAGGPGKQTTMSVSSGSPLGEEDSLFERYKRYVESLDHRHEVFSPEMAEFMGYMRESLRRSGGYAESPLEPVLTVELKTTDGWVETWMKLKEYQELRRRSPDTVWSSDTGDVWDPDGRDSSGLNGQCEDGE